MTEELKFNLKNKLNEMKKSVASLHITGMENLTRLFQNSLNNNKSKETRKAYEETRKLLKELKQILEKEYPLGLIGSKIRQAKMTNQDRPLTQEEQMLKRNVEIAAERCFLVIRVLYKIGTTNLKLKRFSSGFDKYSYANFYRTLCENAPKLFSDTTYLMVEFLIDRNQLEIKSCLDEKKKQSLEAEYKWLNSMKKEVISPKFSLNGLLELVYRFEKKSSFKGLAKKIKGVFLYAESGGGFTLRNEIAHDKKFLSEIDRDYLMNQLCIVNAFNMAVIEVFYLDYLGTLIDSKDTKNAKNLLASIK